MSSVTIIHGYLGRDPELVDKQGQNGPYKQVSFSVGVGRDFGDQTDWYYCIMNGRRAEALAKFFSKGSQIICYGHMESYKPKSTPDQTAWLLKVDSFEFCDRKGNQSNQSAQTSGDLPDTWEQLDEDSPF